MQTKLWIRDAFTCSLMQAFGELYSDKHKSSTSTYSVWALARIGLHRFECMHKQFIMQLLSYTSRTMNSSQSVLICSRANNVLELWCQRQRMCWLKHHSVFCTSMVLWCSAQASQLSLNVLCSAWGGFFSFLYINPVFIWEECLEMSGSLKRLMSMAYMGIAGMCWLQQLAELVTDGRAYRLLPVIKHKH